ncbi:MAG: hypothetical protein R6W06_07345 [Prochlorococcaceae cyanobacterium]
MDELPPLRRSAPRRGPEPLEQRLDRWVSTGRQLVDGVAGARPGSRAGARGAGRRAGSLPRLDGLGRWVEDRLDWFLEDDDWRESWQEEPPQRRRPQGVETRPQGVETRPQGVETHPQGVETHPQGLEPRFQAPQPRAEAERGDLARPFGESGSQGRRSLQAISRRGPEPLQAAATDSRGTDQRRTDLSRTDLPRSDPRSPDPAQAGPDDWPDDTSFQLSRWQRPLRSGPDPLAQPPGPQPPAPSRPLPRSSRRRI